MRSSRLVLALGLGAMLAGCVQTRQYADVQFTPPQGNYRLLVLRPDVTVGSLTTGGMVEPRADWTAALAHLSAALEAEGAEVVTRPWTAPDALDGVDAASPLMVWAYHLDAALWLRRLDVWETSSVPMANSPAVVRWNS